VVGDPSIVMNSMLRYPGNKQFARNLLHWATEDEPDVPRRGGRVLILAGAFQEHGSYGGAVDPVREWTRALADLAGRVRRDGLPTWLSFAMAVCLGLGLVVWVGSRAGRTHHQVHPRYTRPIPIIAQGGLAGRAAVIGGRATRALAMLEIKSSVEEDLAVLLGMDRVPSNEELVERARAARLLGDEALESLRRLLLRMSEIDPSSLSPAARERIRDREVVLASKQASDILDEAHQRAARRALPAGAPGAPAS
jgi:hypothetical protein